MQWWNRDGQLTDDDGQPAINIYNLMLTQFTGLKKGKKTSTTQNNINGEATFEHLNRTSLVNLKLESASISGRDGKSPSIKRRGSVRMGKYLERQILKQSNCN